MSGDLTHLDSRGRARMEDVTDKPVTRRICVARGAVHMQPATLERIAAGSVAKGDVLAAARLAGIQAAKRTDEWIPLCHSLPLDSVEVELLPGQITEAEWRSLTVPGWLRDRLPPSPPSPPSPPRAGP